MPYLKLIGGSKAKPSAKTVEHVFRIVDRSPLK